MSAESLRRAGIALLMVVFGCGGGGCAYLNPFVHSLNVIPVAQEKEIGTKLRGEVAKKLTLVSGEPLNRVQAIGEKLAAVLPSRDFDYRFFVVDDKTPNAFTIPGGSIYVHTGLLAMTNNHELAAVLGHELGHALKRHPTRSMTRAYGVDYLAGLVLKTNKSQLKSIALQVAKQGILIKYGREEELEADAVSADLLRKAGLPTEGLISFLTKIQQLESKKPGLVFFSSHPPTAERVRRLQTLLSSGDSVSVIAVR